MVLILFQGRQMECRLHQNPDRSEKPKPLFQTQRPRLSSSQSTLEPLSINDILRRHSQSRLYVFPIRWTSDQLELLECRFLVKRRPRPRTDQSGAKNIARCGEQQHQAAESKIKLLTRSINYLHRAHSTEFKNL